MKKIAILILFLACTLSAAFFGACDAGNGDNGSEKDGSSVTEVCQHSFANNTFACKDRVCLICGVKVKASEGHTYVKDNVVAPTCEENGYTLNKCACGATQKTDSVAKLGHDFGDYVETVVASCQTVGVKTASCSRCDETDNIYSSALPHVFDSEQDFVKNPTCTENGFTRHVCAVCNEMVLDTYVRAFGHVSDGKHDGSVSPTCETEGYDEHICGVCAARYTDNYAAALGHSWIDGKTTAASCSSVGYKQQECERCHETHKSDMSTQKTAHVFGEDGLCEGCGKTADDAFALSAERETSEIVYIAPDNADGMRRYVLENIGERETITIVLERSIVDGMIAKGYKGVTLRFYNPDELLRLYVWQVSGLNTDVQMGNNFAPNGYSDTCVQYVPFFNENGELSAAIKENGVQWTLFHTVASGQNCAVADSMGVALECSKEFDVSDKATWFDAASNHNAKTEYVANKGWKITATKEEDYDFKIRQETMAYHIAQGATTLTITFGIAFDEATFEGEPLFCRLWIIPASPDGSRNERNWSYKAGYIDSLDVSGFGMRTVTIDLTDTTYDFENFSLDMHVTYSDEAGEKKAVGACYIYDVVFS